MSKSNTTARKWAACTVTVQKDYHGQGASGHQQVVVCLGRPKEFGACIKFTPSKLGKARMANMHIYREGAGNPSASVFFEDGYAKDDPVFDLVPNVQTVHSQMTPEWAHLRDALDSAKQGGDAVEILDALAEAKVALPDKFVEVLESVFAEE